MIRVISKFGDRHKCQETTGSRLLTKNPFTPIPSDCSNVVYQRELFSQEFHRPVPLANQTKKTTVTWGTQRAEGSDVIS